MVILARDKHRESAQKQTRFLIGATATAALAVAAGAGVARFRLRLQSVEEEEALWVGQMVRAIGIYIKCYVVCWWMETESESIFRKRTKLTPMCMRRVSVCVCVSVSVCILCLCLCLCLSHCVSVRCSLVLVRPTHRAISAVTLRPVRRSGDARRCSEPCRGAYAAVASIRDSVYYGMDMSISAVVSSCGGVNEGSTTVFIEEVPPSLSGAPRHIDRQQGYY